MTMDFKDFGEKLEIFRKFNNLKQEELADIVGTTASRISRIERSVADAEMTYLELHRLIKHFNLSAEALLMNCEFVPRKKESGLATKIMLLLEEIKKEYEGERGDS